MCYCIETGISCQLEQNKPQKGATTNLQIYLSTLWETARFSSCSQFFSLSPTTFGMNKSINLIWFDIHVNTLAFQRPIVPLYAIRTAYPNNLPPRTGFEAIITPNLGRCAMIFLVNNCITNKLCSLVYSFRCVLRRLRIVGCSSSTLYCLLFLFTFFFLYELCVLCV